jgi:alpha-amylase
MPKLYFLFGIHNHQPIGNFDYVFEEGFKRCYFPFIDILEMYPKVKCNLHISGPLFDWIRKHHKEFILKLKNLVRRNQIEMISGGYYEPILPLISDEDKLSQIRLMNEFIKKTFRKVPQGLWVPERVWEPYLARIINLAALKYTFLDDTHFRYAGISRDEFLGYYVTEDSAKPIYVFPISKTLRYKIPFSKAQEAIDLLKGFGRPDRDTLVTLFDDGEKFGMWPYTFDWVYQKGWLKNFFSLLTESFDSIQTVLASEAVQRFRPMDLVYLPCASYQEMGEWVLEPKSFAKYESLQSHLKNSPNYNSYKDFVRGGFFRNFYAKYPRLNYMHKRMLSLSEKINRKASPKKDRKIFRYLWKGQCNCGYWHGIFGGFYLGHIRAAIYENLIKAETEFDKKYQKRDLIIEEIDLDLDGSPEVIAKNKNLICVFSQKGGTILELSLREPPSNLINTITRREESYHTKIREKVKTEVKGAATIHDIIQSKDKDLDKYLVYDKYQRLGLVDHILDRDITLPDFSNQHKFKTLGNEYYSFSLKKARERINLIYSYEDKDIEFLKRIVFSKKVTLEVEYNFEKNNILKSHNFGVEFNLFLPSPKDIVIGHNLALGEGRVFKEMTSLVIRDLYQRIKINFEFDRADIFIMPMYSVSSSESGFEKAYQQTTVLFINKDSKDSFSLCWTIKKEV